MSADGSITLNWAGEERKFRLAIGELRELQESVNKTRGEYRIGPWSLYQLVLKGDAWPDDLREIIRLGLIGGRETKPHLIPGLIKRWVDERPILESVPIAHVILGTALIGDLSDQVGKKKTEDDETTSEATFSSSPVSTDQAQPSASRLDRSTSARSGNSQHASTDTIEPTPATIDPSQ